MPSIQQLLTIGALLLQANARSIQRPNMPAAAPAPVLTDLPVLPKHLKHLESEYAKLIPRQYSGSSNSGSSNPGSSDPGSSNPGSSNPGSSNPGSSNPGSSNPGSSNPGSSNPGSSNPGSSNPGSSNPGSSNPGYSNSGSSNPGSSNSGYSNSGSSNPGSSNPGSSNSGSSNPGSSNPGSSNSGSSNPGSSNPGSSNSGSSSDPLCVPYQDPDYSSGTSCQCSGASSLLPTMTGSNMCGYTSLPAQTPAPTPTPSTTFMWTDTSGVVYACPSTTVEDVGVGPITECVGDKTPVSTIASMAAAASQAAQAASFDVPTCLWASDYAGVAQKWVLLIPNWQSTFNGETANNDLKGSLGGNSACQSYSSYKSYAVGLYNTTLAATFDTDIFCTAWQMTNVIKATTGNAQDTACTEYSDSNSGTDPDPSDLIVETIEDGDDGEDVLVKRALAQIQKRDQAKSRLSRRDTRRRARWAV